MKKLIRILFIGAILALLAYNLFRSTCPPAEQIISHWKKNNEEYNAGKISFDELIYRSDRLIECSEKLREQYLKEKRKDGEMVINKPKP